jgi:endonuclease/exonuclease/phosphatase family metal-dependent hydrolase
MAAKKNKGEKSRIRIIIRRTFLGVNILFAAALLLSYLAVHVNPEDFTLPAFFGLAYPYILLCNVIIVITWAVNLKWEAFISVAVILLGITHFGNCIRFGKQIGEPERSFSVMSYNLRLFNAFESGTNKGSEQKVLEFIKKKKPDIICFQELYITGDPAKKDAAIKKALGGRYFSHTKLLGKGKNKYYGIATYSRFPIVSKGDIKHPGSSSLSIYTDIVAEGDTLRVFNNYLQSFRLRRMEQSFMEELIDSEDNQALSEIKSISKSLRSGFRQRALQAQLVKNYINRSDYRVIVAGDFNDTPVSYAYRKIRKGLSDSFVESGYGAGFTYRGNYPPNRIDYILNDKTLECTAFDIPRVRYSDHYPVMAWFRNNREKED